MTTLASDVDLDHALGRIAEGVRGGAGTAETMAYAFLHQAVLEGAIPPGRRLDLGAVAELLGMSSTPVRASLPLLESDGLVRSCRDVGPRCPC